MVSDGRPGSGTHWSVMKLFNLFVQPLPHPSRICTQPLVPLLRSDLTFIWSKQMVQNVAWMKVKKMLQIWVGISLTSPFLLPFKLCCTLLRFVTKVSCDHNDIKWPLICYRYSCTQILTSCRLEKWCSLLQPGFTGVSVDFKWYPVMKWSFKKYNFSNHCCILLQLLQCPFVW